MDVKSLREKLQMTQQDIMSRQLEEIVKMRKLAQKKDEQIDVLLKMIQSTQQSAE